MFQAGGNFTYRTGVYTWLHTSPRMVSLGSVETARYLGPLHRNQYNRKNKSPNTTLEAFVTTTGVFLTTPIESAYPCAFSLCTKQHTATLRNDHGVAREKTILHPFGVCVWGVPVVQNYGENNYLIIMITKLHNSVPETASA